MDVSASAQPEPGGAEREDGAAVARERDHDDVGAFADADDVLRAGVAGSYEEANLLADRRLTVGQRAPDLRSVVPVAPVLRGWAALAAQAVPVLDPARRI